jgi:hypothetical protein
VDVDVSAAAAVLTFLPVALIVSESETIPDTSDRHEARGRVFAL